ncbi:MAG: helix-turn-helix domain-containing protein [Gaiellaceae bacterium]
MTRRELEVLRLLADGLDQVDIAERPVISPKTVATHIHHILEKLGVHSRAQAVAVAHRHRRFARRLKGGLLGRRRTAHRARTHPDVWAAPLRFEHETDPPCALFRRSSPGSKRAANV